jgi:hypothetical protein
MYYVLVFFSFLLLSTGIIMAKRTFFGLAINTTSLLNAMLESSENELLKRNLLIRNLGKEIVSLGKFFIFILLVLSLAIMPVLLYVRFDYPRLMNLDLSSPLFYGCLIAGSIVPFGIISFKKKKQDYSDWSRLLHHIILDNYNLSKWLFFLEKKIYSKRTKNPSENFLIISGLARSGTTAMTKLIFRSGRFHSLNYSNLPFLLSVNLWRKLYHPKDASLKQRAHGDRVLFGYNTVEALEEYFFKVFLKDSFIKEASLAQHDIDTYTFRNYLTYHELIRSKNNLQTIYLAKNNNLILRYKSLRNLSPEFKAIFLFRNPLDHAISLMEQHNRFSRLQQEDHFVQEYMDWLGHHEFGMNHKHFVFREIPWENDYMDDSLNYWLIVWMNYYSMILTFQGDRHLYLVDYDDFLKKPGELIGVLSKAVQIDFKIDQIELFEHTPRKAEVVDPLLLDQSQKIYNQLLEHKLRV